MEDPLQFILAEATLEGERGASLPRLWHFIACYHEHVQVHPSATLQLPEPLADDAADPTAAETPDAAVPVTMAGDQLLDAPYLEFIWRLLVEDMPQYLCRVHLEEQRVKAKATGAASKRRRLAAGLPGAANGDGTEVKIVCIATPIDQAELAAKSPLELYAKYGDDLRFVVPAAERRTELLKKVNCDMSEQLYLVFKEVLRWRAVGITQADISKALTQDPRSTFHFIKTLAARNLVVKFPVVSRGSYTHLTLATQFAHRNASYLATAKAVAGATAAAAMGGDTPVEAPARGPVHGRRRRSDEDESEEDEDDDEMDLDQGTSAPHSRSSTHDGDEDDIDAEETEEVRAALLGAGTGSDMPMSDASAATTTTTTTASGATTIVRPAVLFFDGNSSANSVLPFTSQVLADSAGYRFTSPASGPSQSALRNDWGDKPGVFASLVRQKLSELLLAAPDHTVPSEELIVGLGLDPQKYPRQRKWFNRTIASMVATGHVERIQRPGGPSTRRLVNCIHLLVPYRMPVTVGSLAPLSGGVRRATDHVSDSQNRGSFRQIAVVDDDAPAAAGSDDSGVQVNTPRHNNLDGGVISVTGGAAAANGLVHDSGLLQDGVLADLPFEYQIHRLLALTPDGLTAGQLRRQLGRIGARPFNKFIDRLILSKKTVPGALVVHRVAENRGRERRYRYFTDAAMNSLQAADQSVQVLMREQDRRTAITNLVVAGATQTNVAAASAAVVAVSACNSAAGTPLVGRGAGRGASSPAGAAAGAAAPGTPAPASKSPPHAGSALARVMGTPAPTTEIVDVDTPGSSSAPGTEPRAPRTVSGATFSPSNPPSSVLAATSTRPLSAPAPSSAVSLGVRTTVEAVRRRIILLEILAEHRVALYNHELLKEMQSRYISRYPEAAGSNMDKKTLQRVVEHLRVEKRLEQKVVNFGMIHGAPEKSELLVMCDVDNPVTDEEVLDKVKEIEGRLLYATGSRVTDAPTRDWSHSGPTPRAEDGGSDSGDGGDSDTGSGRRGSTSQLPVDAPLHGDGARAARSHAAAHWRVVAQQYGWQDARMLRAKMLYQFLYERTSAEVAPDHVFETTIIFRELTLGMYLQLIGHTHVSERLSAYFDQHQDTPLICIAEDVRGELLGNDRTKRRFKSHVMHLLNILSALNVIHPVGLEGYFKTVSELSPLHHKYVVPRTFRMLNYLAPRHERVELQERDVSTLGRMHLFWSELEVMRAATAPLLTGSLVTADTPDPANGVARNSPVTSGLTHPAAEEAARSAEALAADGADGADTTTASAAPSTSPLTSPMPTPAPVVVPSMAPPLVGQGNQESDPIKFIGLARNWIPTTTLSKRQRRTLEQVCDPTTGQTPRNHYNTCQELALQTGLTMQRVKQFLKRFEDDYVRRKVMDEEGLAMPGFAGMQLRNRPGAAMSGEGGEGSDGDDASSRTVADTHAMFGPVGASARRFARSGTSAAMARLSERRGRTSDGGAKAVSLQRQQQAGGGGTRGRKTGTRGNGRAGKAKQRGSKLAGTVQLIDPETGAVELAKPKRTRFSWNPEADVQLIHAWVILNYRVTCGAMRSMSWKTATVMFGGRPVGTIRRRIMLLLKVPDWALRAKRLERAWAAHLGEGCPDCAAAGTGAAGESSTTSASTPVLDADAAPATTSGAAAWDLAKCMEHLAALPLDTYSGMAASGPHGGCDLPDSIEELEAMFEVHATPTVPFHERKDQEATARAKLVLMYENAMYVDPIEPEPAAIFPIVSPAEDDEETEKTAAYDGQSVADHADTRLFHDVAAVTSKARPTASGGSTNSAADSDSDERGPPAMSAKEREQMQVVIQLLKMICLTPDSQYNSTQAFAMLHTFSGSVLERALAAVRESGALVRLRAHHGKSRVIPGRNYALSDRFCAQLYGNTAQTQIAQAVRALTQLHDTLQGTDPTATATGDADASHEFMLEDMVEDGTMLALIDLQAAGHIKLDVQINRARLFALPIVPARSRAFDMELPVAIKVAPTLPVPQRQLGDGKVPSTHELVLGRTYVTTAEDDDMMGGEPATPAGPPFVRLGFSAPVWVDPRDEESMRLYCIPRTRMVPDAAADAEVAALEPVPELRPWIVPRIWNNIHGHVEPAILRSAMTCVLAFLMRNPGARLSWLCDRFDLIFQRVEVEELVEQLEFRGAVLTQIADGQVYVFLCDGFYHKIL
ncbi:hypothetical protein H9P43_010031 [Blastocladiella emersonii ATCC 22665]|nr:hypothetical protein H9P43_010031 [Blastocladiella emersonii ATCC 22665]